MKKAKTHIVQFLSSHGWRKSWNTGADGKYTKASAQRRAKQQMSETGSPNRYRARKAKT